MLYFLQWWTLGSSLCSAIAATIVLLSFRFQPWKFIGIAIVTYWILLGLVQWQLLKPYISRAYLWGLVTIVGGIVSNCLLALAFFLILSFLLRNASFVGIAGDTTSKKDALISSIALLVSLLTIGFLLGFAQNTVLQMCLSKNINAITIPIITGIFWLIGVIPYRLFLNNFDREYLGKSILLFILIEAINHFIKGWTIFKILPIEN
ncbi:MAG: hypothetical protein ACRC2R_10610 [Xenococcaceae cyanobacterium]